MADGMNLETVVSVSLLLIIAVAAYFTIMSLMDLRNKKRFVLKSIIKEEEQVIKNIPFLERIVSYKKYRGHVENELREARVSTSFNRFMLERLIVSLAIGLFIFGLGVALKIPIFYFLAIPVMIYMFNIPMNRLKDRKNSVKRQFRMESPQYLHSFGVLLKTKTPLIATKESIEYAGPLLRPYVEMLVTEIELYPGDSRPYMNFANRVEIEEVKEFMIALEQMMKVSPADAHEILDQQLANIDELEDVVFNEALETEELIMNRYTRTTLIPFAVLILSILGVLLYSQLQSIGNLG